MISSKNGGNPQKSEGQEIITMKRCLLIAILVVCAAIAPLAAQSNEFLDVFLGDELPSVKDVSYLVLVSTDMIGEDAGPDRAFELCKELGWVASDRAPDSKVSVSEYAYFLMKAFGRRGGVMFSIAPGPRYAYRELVGFEMIQGKSDPDAPLTGTSAMRIIGRCLDAWGH
jgi:hypothetical protein